MELRLNWNDLDSGELQEVTAPLPITIGRDADNTIELSHRAISRHHARLEEDESGNVVIKDLDSSNGIFIGRQRVTEAVLDDGDSFQLGPFKITIAVVPPATPVTAAVPDATVVFEVEDVPSRAEAPAGQHESELTLRWTDPITKQSQEQVVMPPVSFGRNPGSTILLEDPRISRDHAVIQQHGNELILINHSQAGTFLNGERCEQAAIKAGDSIQMVTYTFVVAEIKVQRLEETAYELAPNATLVFNPDTDEVLPSQVLLPKSQGFPPSFFDAPLVKVSQLRRTGLPVDETTYLAVGGGLGSFVWVDHLLIFGADPTEVLAVGFEEKPYGRYSRLCRNSQIPIHERLRSNSDSCPDNIWGWPGYAVREMWGDFKRGNFGKMFKVARQIFGEPSFAETYTPRSGDVFRSIDREAARIGWERIWRYGRVKAIRRTDDGRYAIAYSQTDLRGPAHRFTVAQYLHLAVGYPALRFLSDLQDYREETGDFKRVVNAYEPHEHVYEDLRKNGGVVLVRGRGIVASRIIQRIYEERQQNRNIAILHLNRSPLKEGARFGRARRLIDNHWEFQPFNWPKACWGGDLRKLLEESSDQERAQLLKQWGGTTTADRRDWSQIVEDGLREGWYQIQFGQVDKVEKDEDGRLITVIRGKGDLVYEARLPANYIIDSTGLEAGIDGHPLLKDLLDTYRLDRNARGGLCVSNAFEIEGMRNGTGRMYACGISTLGGPLAPVDSFLGLQYAALRSVDDLATLRAPGLRHLNGLRSFIQWLRWARGVRP